MSINREFTWETALQTTENLVFNLLQKHLSDIEIVVLRGAWDDLTYEQIAEFQGYTSNYLSKDVGNKLWGNLSTALQEKVSKKNFKAALQREWQKQSPNSLPQSQSQPQASESQPTENLTFPEGPIALDSPFYLQRLGCESFCYETIAKPGSLIRIKGAKWMGKTSLVNRILEHGRSQDRKTVYLDCASIKRSIVQDLDRLLPWLCVMVSRQLELDNKVKEYWDMDILGSNDNCTLYFEEYILAQTDCEIIFALDNIDKLFPYEEVIEDFFGMLRSWHEKGKVYHCWTKLKLILAHSTEIYIPLDINQSPFNTGIPILLEEFTPTQAESLISLYQLNWERPQINQLMDLIGGHPYLIQLAMYQIKAVNLTIEQFIQEALSETGIYSNLSRHLLNTVKQSPELVAALTKVVRSDRPIELNSLHLYQLHSIGLVQQQDNLVSPGCKLYRIYFDRVLPA